MKSLFPTPRWILAAAVALMAVFSAAATTLTAQEIREQESEPRPQAHPPPSPALAEMREDERPSLSQPQDIPHPARPDGARRPGPHERPRHQPDGRRDRGTRAAPHPDHSPSDESPSRRGSEGHSDFGGDLLVLERLLSMPPEQLARMREAIERIERMSPQERVAMRDRLREFRHFSPEQRQQMRKRWRETSPEERREHFRNLRERRWEQLFGDEEPQEAAPHPSPDQ